MIDRNRGCTIRIHPAGGFRVFMYKDQPGIYMDPHGSIISEKVAADAGFDVERLATEKLRRERTAEEIAKIDRQFGNVGEGEVVFEQGGYQVVAQGKAFGIKSDGGTMLTQVGLAKSEAIKLAKRLANAEETDPEPAQEEKSDAKAS